MEKTSIIILTYNKLEYTQFCIESIREYTPYGTYEIIIVDNNSTDGTKEWIRLQTDIIPIINESNLGFPKGCNQGISIATGDYILLLNNDTIVTRNWLHNMVSCLNSDEGYGAVSCVTNSCSYAQAISVEYQSTKEMQEFAKDFNVQNCLNWEERLKLIGFCFLVKKTVVQEIGFLDERFSPGNLEDDDYSLRIRKAGYKLILCKDTFIHHFGSTSFKERPDFTKLINDNILKFKEKWGFDPINSQHIHFDVFNMINSSKNAKLNILEIGCGCGGTLLKIKNEFQNSSLFGIESNSEVANIASLIAETQMIDLDFGMINSPENYFDYIIFVGSLERFKNPWKVLLNVKRFLKPSGHLIVKFSNMIHHSILKKLLDSTWLYDETSSIDRNRFGSFTLNDINRMMNESGYENIKITGNKTLNTNEEDIFVDKISQLSNIYSIDQFSVLNYLVDAQKSPLFETIENIDRSKDEYLNVIGDLTAYSCEEIIEIIPSVKNINSFEMLNYLGVIHFENGIYDKVLPFFENAYNYQKNNEEVLYNISYYLYFIGEKKIADEFSLRLKELNSNSYNDLISTVLDFKVL